MSAAELSIEQPQDLALKHAQDPFFLQIPHPDLTSFRVAAMAAQSP
jgi:hypothetical protein